MFNELLSNILSRTPGSVAVSVMGFDGIPLDGKEGANADESLQHQTTIVELGNLARQIRRMSDDVGTGAVNEFCVSAEGLHTVLRPISDEYFIAISLKKGGNVGKGRFLLRTALPELRKELL